MAIVSGQGPLSLPPGADDPMLVGPFARLRQARFPTIIFGPAPAEPNGIMGAPASLRGNGSVKNVGSDRMTPLWTNLSRSKALRKHLAA